MVVTGSVEVMVLEFSTGFSSFKLTILYTYRLYNDSDAIDALSVIKIPQ